MANLNALRAELDAGHPETGAYNDDDALAADEINVKNRTEDRTMVPGWELFAAIAPADFLTVYTSGADANRSYLNVMFVLSTVPLDNAGVRTALTNIFSGMGGTLNAIQALQTILVSRASELDLGKVAAGTVEQARAL